MSGLPRLTGVKELRLLFSPASASSAGLREFISKNYGGLRNINPNVQFMIREANNSPARIYARYAFGKERMVSADGCSSSEILKKFSELNSV
nr:NADH dehydrogenase [Hymenolepis microstoma]